MTQTDEEKREKRNKHLRDKRARERGETEEAVCVPEEADSYRRRDIEEDLQDWLANNVARYYRALNAAKAPNGLIEKMVIDYHTAMLAVLNQKRGN